MNALRVVWALVPVSLLFVGMRAVAQPALHLKTREGQNGRRGTGPEILRTRTPARRHLILEFQHRPDAGQLERLREAGVRILQYIPDFAYVVNAPAELTMGAEAGRAVVPGSMDKLSPELTFRDNPGDIQFALVQFYPDVDMDAARAIVLEMRLQITEHPDLTGHDLLVSGTAAALARVADWDEVAYLFPASDELLQGVPVNACAGAMTQDGQIGQLVATAGDGWDGPGLNGADLTYAFASLTDQLPADSTRSEVVRAFNEWAKHAKLSFTATSDLQASRSITVLFGRGEHGDGFPFTSSTVLAHTFYPFPVNQEPIAGDMHFNAAENWRIGADTDLFSVALHESGHALGLGHSDKPGAVMYPYYKRTSGLTQEDISAILTLYAPQTRTAAPAPDPLVLSILDPGSATPASTATLTGTVSGTSGPITLTWITDRGSSGSAPGSEHWTLAGIPLSPGANTITVTAATALQARVSNTVTIIRFEGTPALTLKITGPSSTGAYSALSNSLTLSGTVSGGSAASAVNWSNSRGRSGTASGTANWTAAFIPLDPGGTRFTVTVSSGPSTASQTLDVTYTPPPTGGSPPPAPPATDTTPPSLSIVSPALTSVNTSAASISFSGTAKDNVGVVAVTWTTSNGDSGTATGTDFWSIPAIPLLVGSNSITVRARDAAGNTSWRSVVVNRR